jgi:hypothetical protein
MLDPGTGIRPHERRLLVQSPQSQPPTAQSTASNGVARELNTKKAKTRDNIIVTVKVVTDFFRIFILHLIFNLKIGPTALFRPVHASATKYCDCRIWD